MGGWVGWLDNWVIMLNLVQLSWKLTELGKIGEYPRIFLPSSVNCHPQLAEFSFIAKLS